MTKLFGGSRYLIQSIHAKKLRVRIFSRLGRISPLLADVPARAYVHTHTRHKASIHIFQPPSRSLTLSNAFLRLRRKKALGGKKFFKPLFEVFFVFDSLINITACKHFRRIFWLFYSYIRVVFTLNYRPTRLWTNENAHMCHVTIQYLENHKRYKVVLGRILLTCPSRSISCLLPGQRFWGLRPSKR